jgi:hypothetical protein
VAELEPLLGPVLKLNRAEDHLHELNQAVARFVKSNFYDVARDFDRQGRLIARVSRADDPPADLSILIGECIYNWRSALDQVAYQLALVNLGGPLPQDIAESSAFPIFNNGPAYRRKRSKGPLKGQPAPTSGLYKIRGCSRGARAAIQRLQPYHRRKNPDLKALWVLEQLSNIDKHRLLHLTGASLAASRYDLEATGPFTLHKIETFPRPMEAGAMLARFTATASPETHMHVKHHMLIDVAFDKRSPVKLVRGKSVVHTLRWIGMVVSTQVMPQLAPWLPGDLHIEVEEMPLPGRRP